MAVSTFSIGILPTKLDIGSSAVFPLIILRLFQGISAGGESLSSTCFIFKIASIEKKNFYCSLVAASSMFGVFWGSFTVAALHFVFSENEILRWAWRIPFLLSFVMAIIIYMSPVIIQNIAIWEKKPKSLEKNIILGYFPGIKFRFLKYSY